VKPGYAVAVEYVQNRLIKPLARYSSDLLNIIPGCFLIYNSRVTALAVSGYTLITNSATYRVESVWL
jgi:hypothetical protein